MTQDSDTVVFINKSQTIHGHVFDYSDTIYIDSKTPLNIVCPTHGMFTVQPSQHITGSLRGCRSCSVENKQLLRKKEFIQKSNIVHHNKFSYDNVVFVNATTPVTITCPKHGNFLQRPNIHVKSMYGCARCAKIQNNKAQTMTVDVFIAKARTIHGADLYDYSQVTYVNCNTLVQIICDHHGVFTQRPTDHLSGRGCSECAGCKRWSTSEFIVRAKSVHGDTYDYSKSIYSGVYTNTIIICKLHGKFSQFPGNHVNNKAGCPTCAKLNNDLQETKTTSQFISDAQAIHGNVYDYSVSKYVHSHTKVQIRCNKHGVFEQAPNDHTNNSTRCPTCSAEQTSSIGEKQVIDFIERTLHIKTIHNDRTLIRPLELDIYIPEHKLAIEYCGVYWHSEQLGKDRHYHLNKHRLCESLGIQLITLFEDEWLFRTDQVKRKLTALLHTDHSKSVFARSTQVIRMSSSEKKQFLDIHHMQRSGPGSVTLGLKHNEKLVACMSFIKQKNNEYTLNRYATSCRVPGGFSKLLKYFQRTTKWSKIISFADKRWSDGNLYAINGWTLDSTIPPDYSYVKGNKRIHKFNYRRKHLPKLLTKFDPKLSEWENCKADGVLRVWDCGKLRYVMVNKSTNNGQ